MHDYSEKISSCQNIENLSTKIISQTLNSITLIEKEISTDFPDDVINESNKIAKSHSTDQHRDFTHLPFVTVDPSDARDHDDAIFAVKEIIDKKVSIYKVYVAIADVSFFVAENSNIDLEARKRGNSTYLPGLCIPMLPERLSFDLCSLRENEIRPCLLVEMLINDRGEKTSHTFHRAVIKNRKAMTYSDLESFRLNGSNQSSSCDKSLTALCEVYKLLKEATKKRSPLELDFPETSVGIDNEDKVTKIEINKKNVSHSIIEELMILANVCAVETICKKFDQVLFRVHPSPSKDKLDNIFNNRVSNNFRYNRDNSTRAINKLIKSTSDLTDKLSVQNEIIKILEQASYCTKNIGHFGLNLDKYCTLRVLSEDILILLFTGFYYIVSLINVKKLNIIQMT